jgi:surfeit locus 1 family protein
MLRESAAERPLRAGRVVPVLFACAVSFIFLGLGTWQIQRKFWKEALIDRLEERLSAAAEALPPRARWSGLDQTADEFRRVKFSGAFITGAEALVYASGSSIRGDASGPGYWVFALARLASGGSIVVNRGFVPEGWQDPKYRSTIEMNGSIDMIGVLRWPEVRTVFAPTDRPDSNLWFVRDPGAIAAAKGWGEVAPFYLEFEAPQPPGGLPRAGPLKVSLRNAHLQYALTWYGLALAVAVLFVVWLRQPQSP